jgi:serine protease AprX
MSSVRRSNACLRKSLLIVCLIGLVLGAVPPVTPTSGAAPLRAEPGLLALAAEQPHQHVSVIVQKRQRATEVEALVGALGGVVSRDLSLINSFVAELPAGALPALAGASGVHWVSPNADMQTTQAAQPVEFTTWATEQGKGLSSVTAADFNSTAIPAGRTVWFNSVVKVDGRDSRPATVTMTLGSIEAVVYGTPVSLALPNSRVIFDATVSMASTTYDAENAIWETRVPVNYTGNVFLTGLAVPLTTNVPGSIKDVTWKVHFSSDTPDLSAEWKWSAAVYSNFASDMNALGVKPIDGDKLNPYANNDHAGAPENFKAALVSGARGGGGSNYTGSYSSNKSLLPVYFGNNNSLMLDSPVGPNQAFGHGSWLYAAFGGFEAEVTPGHAIVKVEALLRAYVPVRVGDDLRLSVVVGGVPGSSITLRHEAFDPFIGSGNVGTVVVDLTANRAWKWGDFEQGVQLLIDQSRLKPEHSVYYDAVGLRITSVPGLDETGVNGPTSLPAEPLDVSRLVNSYNKTVRATDVWNKGPKYLQGQGVTVAVLDSGVGKSHDLEKRNLKSLNFNQGKHNSKDKVGHGTFVAGVIAGNGKHSKGQYIGIAPKTNLLSVRVSDDEGLVTEADVVAALQWIYENKALYNIRVVNLSLNSSVAQSYHTSPLNAAVEILWFNGIVVVVSAGNQGEGALYPPANDPFVITVGATDDQGTPYLSDDIVASFSAYGLTEAGFAKPDLVAPGKNLIGYLPGHSELKLGLEHTQHRVNKHYFRMSGTSMSAPLVSGAVALLLQDEPELTPDQVKYRLMATAAKADRWPSYDATQAGAGLLDIYAAVHGTTTESANTDLVASQLLWTGDEPITWTSVRWNSVRWNSVRWNSVRWNSVRWNSVRWNSDYWGE